jgi:2-keto-4-pentenoate hydratase/2-oxohepta-3-ene-1,7-dioic acid hydratase in catechol pathway
MRLVTYRSERGSRAGVLRDGRVIDAWDVLEPGSAHPSVRALLEQGLADRLAKDLAGEGVPLEEVALEVPVPDPEKIVCIGLNYRSHAV